MERIAALIGLRIWHWSMSWRIRLSVLPYDRAAEHFGQFRTLLESAGASIGPYDLQIASIAMARGLVVVTHNVNEFSRVPGLVIEDWQF
jgi:tRNA(fMet)-specific endonuclease VapC